MPQYAFKKIAGLPECLASLASFRSVCRFRAWLDTVFIVWRENRAFRNCPVSPDAGFAYFWKASRADSPKVSSPSNWQTSLTSCLLCWSVRVAFDCPLPASQRTSLRAPTVFPSFIPILFLCKHTICSAGMAEGCLNWTSGLLPGFRGTGTAGRLVSRDRS